LISTKARANTPHTNPLKTSLGFLSPTIVVTPLIQPPMSTTKSVDASLWWAPFTDLLTELENLSPSSALPISLANKLKEHHLWLLNSVSLFKLPNQKSKEALDAQQVQIGSHRLTVQSKFKELALKISSSLCLDEVQSYILVERSCELDESDLVALEPLHLKVMIQYYIERQCVLKCTRHLLMLSCKFIFMLYFVSNCRGRLPLDF
ncbi:hypothetical protein M8C21_012230, partial [Ambrosia artemisiifolia]